MRKLYCFDFDGTLTRQDTMFLFLKFYDPSQYYFQFLRHLPVFLLLKLNLADAEKVKKSFIASILKGEKKAKIEQKAKSFFEKYYPEIIRENAVEFIQEINHNTTKSLLVTASLDIWAKPFAEKFKMVLVSTKAEFKNDIFTGDFIGKNCNGPEKVKRIEQEIEGTKFDKTIAFGDTSGDTPMLKWATESHYRFFH